MGSGLGEKEERIVPFNKLSGERKKRERIQRET